MLVRFGQELGVNNSEMVLSYFSGTTENLNIVKSFNLYDPQF